MLTTTTTEQSTLEIVQKYINTDLCIKNAKSMTYGALMEFFRDKDVIQAIKACLQRIHHLAVERHGRDHELYDSQEQIIINVRIFNAAYLIAYHPLEVFQQSMGGEDEKALQHLAQKLLFKFESICATILLHKEEGFAKVPHNLTKDFEPVLLEYIKCFKAWNEAKTAKNIPHIKQALLKLYVVLLKNPNHTELKSMVTAQIERLRSTLQQLAGGPEALERFDEECKAMMMVMVAHDDGLP